ncbi:hypothetical protein GCM10028803_34560 [Larkinella knui]|uniref:Uncharacterized protein n=1 Tax=Larkinella knui TaxID=2025310 RepID=A0A3P1CDB5_9BACT|nr:hypothetical protein [Larkinella knui]RRB11333.1 hypothetical protein EHT87_22865 [Larkinella knui]
MTAIHLKERVRNGGIFVPLSPELDNQEVEIDVIVRPVLPLTSSTSSQTAQAFFDKVTVRSTEDFDAYDQ